MSADLDMWKAKLKQMGYMGYVPEEPSKPDIPVVIPGENPSVTTGFLMLCANQCRRDQGHKCGVEIGYEDMASMLLDEPWKQKVCDQIPWMLVTWGPHGHCLPFCCSTCLIQFVQERTERSELVHNHDEHDH